MSENAVLPQTHLIRYVPKTQDISFVLPEVVAIKDLLHPWHKLSLKFGIFICDRNSNICQNRGSQTFSDHVPLQHFDRWICTSKLSYDKKDEYNHKNPL